MKFKRGLTRQCPVEYLTFSPISAIFQSFWPKMADEKVLNVTRSREPCRKRALKCRIQINYTHARRLPVPLTHHCDGCASTNSLPSDRSRPKRAEGLLHTKRQNTPKTHKITHISIHRAVVSMPRRVKLGDAIKTI